jgi:hypothetical protein
MTVISSVITRHCTVHASDSLITVLREDGTREPYEWQKSKIVPVHHWRGAMAYWGLAQHDAYRWSTFDWLCNQAKTAADYSTVEEFALGLADKLNDAISKMQFSKPVHSGIGIHLTAYELVDGYWIPELFLVSNWVNTSYNSIRAQGVGISRETYHTVADVSKDPKHREPEYRLKVHAYLHQPGGMLIYNNGDPIMFNAAAYAVLGMFRSLEKRGKLDRADDVRTYLAIARRPIEVVSRAQIDFCREGTRIVGGKPHDLAVTPTGDYSSTTGDA